MDITPLENMKMLVGENAFHEAESQITRKPKPGIAAQQGWADVNEALEASSDEDSSRLKEGSNKRVVNNFADGPLSRGELCKLATDFCPAIAASRLHFKYKDKRPQGFDEANERYFDKGKFWERKWTLYVALLAFIVPVANNIPLIDTTSLLGSSRIRSYSYPRRRSGIFWL